MKSDYVRDLVEIKYFGSGQDDGGARKHKL